MKFLTWFISVMIMLMICAPCMDSSSFMPSKPIMTYQASSNAQEQTPVKDGCSPFCMCACCSIPTFIEQATISIPALELIPIQYSQKAFGKAIGAELSVWQPPQLG